MSKAGGVIGIVAGILGFLASITTFTIGGFGAALGAAGAEHVFNLAWGGAIFSITIIVLGACAFSQPRIAGIGLIISSILGAILGGTLVAVCMIISLVGGFLAAIGESSPQPQTAEPNVASSRLNPWLGLVLGICLALAGLVLLNKPKSPATNTEQKTDPLAQLANANPNASTEQQTDPLAQLANANPSALRADGELAAIFNLGSDYTDLQREIKSNEIKGKIVDWDLPVYEIARKETNYRIVTQSLPGKSTVGVIVYLTVRSEEDRKLVESIKTGDSLHFRGKISDVSLRTLRIDPAILVTADSINLNRNDCCYSPSVDQATPNAPDSENLKAFSEAPRLYSNDQAPPLPTATDAQDVDVQSDRHKENPPLNNTTHSQIKAREVGNNIAPSDEGPSFNCAIAKSKTELLICNDHQLSAMDKELAKIHAEAKSTTLHPDQFKKFNQRRWKERESECTTRECLIQWYAARKGELEKDLRESKDTN